MRHSGTNGLSASNSCALVAACDARRFVGQRPERGAATSTSSSAVEGAGIVCLVVKVKGGEATPPISTSAKETLSGQNSWCWRSRLR
jgi:hypothetical protein